MKRPLPPSSPAPDSQPSSAHSPVKIWADWLWQRKSLNSKASLKPTQNRRWLIDPSSLRFRLTVGVTTFSILGLGGVSAWTSWKMQQVLINTHTENVKYVAERFPQDVTLYSEMLPIAISVQKAIDNLSPPGLLLWVTDPEGDILSQSQALSTYSDDFITRLFTLSRMPVEPKIYQVGQRYLVLCSSPLIVEGERVGQLHLAQDITVDQHKLNGAIQGLMIVSALSVIVMAIAIALYIRQALQPLSRMSHVASTISANRLSQAKLSLTDAPTEVRELAETLNEMLSRLAQSWEQQRQLIGDISHELRTPLTVSYGYLQSIQRRSASLNEMQREMLETAMLETDRTIQLLQSLLELARADSGCMYLHPQSIHLNKLAAEVVKMSQRLSQRDIQLEAKHDEIWITTDRNCLMQVLTNLVDNAIKYSPPEQPILLQLDQTPEHIIIQVRDYGCGIPIEQQPRIFDRFYRVDDARSRETGGVGLGLSIVKTLVEGMNGQITLWSKPGEGCLFIITLPPT